jgi:hypothetical protein
VDLEASKIGDLLVEGFYEFTPQDVRFRARRPKLPAGGRVLHRRIYAIGSAARLGVHPAQGFLLRQGYGGRACPTKRAPGWGTRPTFHHTRDDFYPGDKGRWRFCGRVLLKTMKYDEERSQKSEFRSQKRGLGTRPTFCRSRGVAPN